MSRTRTKNISLSAIALILLAALLIVKVFDIKCYRSPEKVIAWDVISYYAYLPGTFIEHDYTLSFVGSDTAYYEHYWPLQLPNGHYVIKTTMGLSMLYSPFFFAANAVAPHIGAATDGYSPPYALALILACVCYVLLGCYFLRKVLLSHFSELTSSIVLLIVVVTTNLYWYATYEAAYPHGFLFGLICIFLYQTERWHRRPTWLLTVALGLNIGLISLIRPSDVLVVVYFLLYGLTSWHSVGEKVRFYLHHIPMAATMAAAAVAMWVPQMLYWHSLTGHLFFYSYGDKERFFWGNPKLWQVLLGFRKGWLTYSPIMLFALVGLWPLCRRHRLFFWPTLILTVLNLYVLSAWWCWWYGGCFGQRSMVDCYGLLAMPLAASTEWILQRRGMQRAILICLFVATAFLSFFHYRQYKHGAIHYDSMTPAAYFDSFGHVYPSARFYDLLQQPDYDAARRGDR